HVPVAFCFFFSSRRRHTRWPRDWSSDVCSSDLHLGDDRVGDLAAVERGASVRLNQTQRLRQARVADDAVEGGGLSVDEEGRVRRSEERRVGKEGRWRVVAEDVRKEVGERWGIAR